MGWIRDLDCLWGGYGPMVLTRLDLGIWVVTLLFAFYVTG